MYESALIVFVLNVLPADTMTFDPVGVKVRSPEDCTKDVFTCPHVIEFVPNEIFVPEAGAQVLVCKVLISSSYDYI